MRPLFTEALEPRRLLHGEGVIFTDLREDGVLRVNGFDDSVDPDVLQIFISTVEGTRFVNVVLSGLEGGEEPSQIGYQESDVVGVLVNTFQGDDQIYIAQTGGSWNLPVTVQAGKGNDTIVSGPGADSLVGGAGNDMIRGGAGADVIIGGDGNDDLGGGPDDDTILGGFGNDAVLGGAGTDRIFGLSSDGVPLPPGLSDFDTLAGGAGDDILGGGPNADILYGGNDFEGINSGNDILNGGTGHDTLYGGDGNDALTGGRGNDGLFGGTGTNSFFAQDGLVDTLTGTAGATTLLFDVGLDTLS